MKDAIITIAVLLFDAFLLGGTAYLVQVHGWSMWTFALALLFFLVIKDKKEEEKPEEKRIIL